MKTTIWCNHYLARYTSEKCAAGIEYSRWQGKPITEWPCFRNQGQTSCIDCEKAQFPTREELEAEEREIKERFDKMVLARNAIVAYLGGPWKRGMGGVTGTMDCPVCGTAGSLRFSRARYNGHIHAQCQTKSCVAWME